MATLREIITKLGFKVDKAGLARANTGMRTLQTQTQRTGRAAKKASLAFAGIGTAILAQGLQQARKAVAFLTTDFAASTDMAAKQARALGLTIGSLQRLTFASKIAGASQKDVTTGLRVLAKRLRDARLGLSTAKKAFAEVGISAKSLKGQRLDVVFKRLANRFKGIADPAQKAALAQELFGRGGLALINTLNLGSAGIGKLGDRAQRLGIVMSQQTAKKAEDFTDAMLEAKSAVQGIRNVIAAQLLPKITALAKRFANFIATGDNLAKTVKRVRAAVKALAIALTILSLVKLGKIGIIIGVIGLVVKELSKTEEGMETLKEIGSAFSAIGKDLAPIFVQLVNAVKPLIPIFAKLLGQVAKVAVKVIKVLVPVFAFVAKAFGEVIKAVIKIFKFMGRVWKKVVRAFQPTIRAVGVAFKAVGDVVARVVSDIRSVFMAVFSFIKSGIKVIGKVLAFVLKPFELLAKGLKIVFQGVVTAVKAVAATARKIANNPLVKLLIKGGKFLTGGGQRASLERRIRAGAPKRPAGRGKTSNVTVGQVSVTVQGTTGMGPEALKAAVAKGTRDAIGDISADAFRDFTADE